MLDVELAARLCEDNDPTNTWLTFEQDDLQIGTRLLTRGVQAEKRAGQMCRETKIADQV
jgi:hypothetical protein